MNVLMINGSAHSKGCTFTALSVIGETLKEHQIDSEIVHLGAGNMQDCIGCNQCKDNRCVFDDICNQIIEKAEKSDGFIFGTPVYYAHPSGMVLSAINRMFYAGKPAFTHKPGAAIASARRAGTTASVDVLNKYFSISQMPIVSSTYWNMVHGNTPEEVRKDLEGIQTMKNLANNMAWLLKSIEAGKSQGLKTPENPIVTTNFIR
ncbi:multimeric flavodoxin WrbA [Clostridiales Family XIII bacterium PM5-7]